MDIPLYDDNNSNFQNTVKNGFSINDASSNGADTKRRTKNQRKNMIESEVADSRDDNSHLDGTKPKLTNLKTVSNATFNKLETNLNYG